MAQVNQPNYNSLGFANPIFVLIKGGYWDSNVTRRRIQGQICLDEFADILLEWFLHLPEEPLYMSEWGKESPLQDNGSLEVLKYALKNPFYVDGARDPLVSNFADNVRQLRKLRNKLTHEVRSWKIDDFRNFLEAMKNASSWLVDIDSPNALDGRVNAFISKCGSEIENINTHQELY
ncbi:uncharacterized protein LOC130695219 [Daphnia carinata]|uniref:uncharacterized protein LOC130695219 n=1 Tax=Daphnia carinata TaxID=120202 RepID=UPI00257B010E|nr:uncharacterized protein LOC130695219 [Daphnia carinata]